MSRVRPHVVAMALSVLAVGGMLTAATLLNSPGTTVVAPPALRSGTFVSPDVVIGSGITTAAFAFTGMPASDYENPANSMQAEIDCSADGVTGFFEAAGFGWHGTNGPYTDPKTGIVDPVNGVTFDVRRLVGFTCHASALIPLPITVGLTVTTQ